MGRAAHAAAHPGRRGARRPRPSAPTATVTTAAALLGGTLAATSHFAKATTRAAANTSPEPFSNIGLSLAGDAAVPAALWLAWAHPWAFFGVLALALALMGVLLWKLGALPGRSCCGG